MDRKLLICYILFFTFLQKSKYIILFLRLFPINREIYVISIWNRPRVVLHCAIYVVPNPNRNVVFWSVSVTYVDTYRSTFSGKSSLHAWIWCRGYTWVWTKRWTQHMLRAWNLDAQHRIRTQRLSYMWGATGKRPWSSTTTTTRTSFLTVDEELATDPELICKI